MTSFSIEYFQSVIMQAIGCATEGRTSFLEEYPNVSFGCMRGAK
jgi:hypothetical protein